MEVAYDYPQNRNLANALNYYTRKQRLEEEIKLKEAMKRIVELINHEIEE